MVCERWSRFFVPPFSCWIQVLFFEFLKDIERLLSAFNTELLIVERYNQFAESGKDEDFHKSAANLIAISEPPFYAFNEGLATLVTVSGLKVNPFSQVLNADEKPIEGLYALGNCSGSMFSDTYPHHLAGVSHGRCVTFGYLLGRRLANIED